MKKQHIPLIVGLLFIASVFGFMASQGVGLTTKTTSTPSRTPTTTATRTRTPIVTHTHVSTSTPTREVTSTATSESQPKIEPYPSAPACPPVENNVFHTLWNDVDGCHYDHEHGTDPFTEEVQTVFPDFDLIALLCGNEVGHCNPTSEMENIMKHGGFKWDVILNTNHGCVAGFEGARYCILAAIIQRHGFGNYAIEMETSVHSADALLKIGYPGTSEVGYIFVSTHQQYGQRVFPYQGTALAYPNFPFSYDPLRGQYFTLDCLHPVNIQCRHSIADVLSRKLNVASKWTSKISGTGARPQTNPVFGLLWDVRDAYQLLDMTDTTYPYTFRYLCGDSVYAAANCQYNNSASRSHEANGTIPAAWDNLIGFDTNPIVGHITADGFLDEFGNVNLMCEQAGIDCYPVKMINMPVGQYGDWLQQLKVSILNKENTPENDIYFCNGVFCVEGSANAVPSGWIGSEN